MRFLPFFQTFLAIELVSLNISHVLKPIFFSFLVQHQEFSLLLENAAAVQESLEKIWSFEVSLESLHEGDTCHFIFLIKEWDKLYHGLLDMFADETKLNLIRKKVMIFFYLFLVIFIFFFVMLIPEFLNFPRNDSHTHVCSGQGFFKDLSLIPVHNKIYQITSIRCR